MIDSIEDNEMKTIYDQTDSSKIFDSACDKSDIWLK